jgi:hypothetical protein
MNNEVWLLEARIEYDLQWFDCIILAEANTTQSGISKPLFFEKYQDIFAKYRDRIIYVKITDLPRPYGGNFIGSNNFKCTENRWIAEFYQKKILQDSILNIAKSGDAICFQDIDEIQDISTLDRIQNFQCINYLKYLYFKCSVGLKSEPNEEPWIKAFVTNYDNMEKIIAADYRRIDFSRQPYKLSHMASSSFRFNDEEKKPVYNQYQAPIQDINIVEGFGGWHLSSMTNDIDNRAKWECFAHQEFSQHFKTKTKNFNLEKITNDIITNHIDKKSNKKLHPLAPKFLNNSRFASIFRK